MSETGILDRLAALDTNSVSDALDLLQLEGATYGIRPLWDCPKIVGRASTVKVGPKTEVATAAHPFAGVIDSIVTDDRILVISNNGLEGVSCWGDIIANASKQRGIRGTVIDGVARDINGSREVGYPVYGHDLTMISGRSRMVQVGAGVPVQMRGVTVREGDYVIADECGTVFIPAERIEDVLDMSEKIDLRESLMIQDIRDGRSVSDVISDAKFRAINVGTTTIAAVGH
ncbi:hypothetical protein N7478_012605 [Penicillium angulare]|uniref:uncharacterized protein n=1 Tax=Penicillium angulare TaxID=116970 RepID=UPI00254094F3|nr:uncharacterized protein N7478_012605 [Penicillium angulare]KAJ5259624.1 hypothetical protein N7478_012605 [Penicillium angulare]